MRASHTEPRGRRLRALAAGLVALALLAMPGPGRAESATSDPPAALDEAATEPLHEAGALAPPPATRSTALAPQEEQAESFGPQLWRGAPLAEIRALLDRLPVGAPSPAMHGLMRRLLVTDAEPPDGPDDHGSLLALRARRMAQLGLADDLAVLAGGDADVLDDPVAAVALADALLLVGQVERACTLGQRMAARSTAYWRQLDVLCRIRLALRGEPPGEARLILTRLEESGEGDPVFAALAEALLDGTAPAMPDQYWRRMADPDALILAALDLANRPVAPAALAGADPARLVAIAASRATATSVRIDAAEWATAAGALPVEALAILYGSVPLGSDDPFSRVPDARGRDQGVRQRPVLYQEAARDRDGQRALRRRQFAVALSLGEEAPLTTVLALLTPVEPRPDQAPLAIDAAAVHYAAGRTERGRAWHAIASADPHADRAALSRLWPLALLAGATADAPDDTPARRADRLSAWMDAELARGDAGRRAAAVVLGSLSALHVPVESGLWRRLPLDGDRDVASLPAAPVWWRLPQAAAGGQTGLTVLLALSALGERGPAQAHPVVLERVLSALVAVGLAEDARRLALEAVWAAQW